MVRPMVHSTKHYVQFSITTVIGGAVGTGSIVQAVAVVDKNAPAEVEEGSTIKAVYFELWVRAGDTVGGSGQMIIYKSEGDTTAASAAELALLNDWENKKNILYTTQGLFNDQDADAIAVYKGWLKIPKGKQRFGLNDKLRFTLSAAGAIDLHFCGFATYKEYT